MPEIHRKLQVTFSKAEIKAILAEKARALVLDRKDGKRVELDMVEHVEGEATVTLIIGNKTVAVPMRDKLIEARDELICEAGKLAAYIDGRQPIPKNILRRKRKK